MLPRFKNSHCKLSVLVSFTLYRKAMNILTGRKYFISTHAPGALNTFPLSFACTTFPDNLYAWLTTTQATLSSFWEPCLPSHLLWTAGWVGGMCPPDPKAPPFSFSYPLCLPPHNVWLQQDSPSKVYWYTSYSMGYSKITWPVAPSICQMKTAGGW